MRTFALLATTLAFLLVGPVASAQSAPAAAPPRYAAQIQAELQAMGMAPQCASTVAASTTCTVRASALVVAPGSAAIAAPRRFVLSLRYDDATDTIYAFIDHYATIRADAANSAQVFRRLAELNWEMLIGKFEWSPTTGEIRLSAVLNTDSNFDRRAFRGVVRSLLRLAERYADEFARLTGAPVGDTSMPAAAASPSPSAAPAAPAPAPAAAPQPAPSGSAAPGTSAPRRVVPAPHP